MCSSFAYLGFSFQFIGDRADYKSNEWNYFDIGALTLYITGFTLRMIYHRDPTICPECLYVARIILAFSLLIFFGRTLQFLSAYESLGPKIYMLYGLVSRLSMFVIRTCFLIAQVINTKNSPPTIDCKHENGGDVRWMPVKDISSVKYSYCNYIYRTLNVLEIEKKT